MRQGHDITERWRPKSRAEKKQDSYTPWAREVYGKRPPRNQGDGVQQQAQQQQGSDDRPRRSLDWRPRAAAGDAELRINYADASTAMMDGADYVRVAPKHEQRSGLMWPAYIYNVSQSLLRQDIAAFFDGYNLPEEEIRPEFSWKHFAVERFWVNFGSPVDRERAMSRHMAYLGTRRVLMRKATATEFGAGVYNPLAMSSRGRYVLVENLAPTTTSEDVIRFFQGYDLHAKSVTFLRENEKAKLSEAGLQHPKARLQPEKAVVRFTSPLEAHRAVRDRQAGFCGNNALRLRVLQ
ncbi:hypothetical protein CHLNCDRAFT_52363 [Chlorella variabilis]|uniref:RRM domain-containing protein n=1 Tax=Chlorella variabilis TaxID=554065 RepID=E1ZES5_CHLVA|nr:hypothetical protein CHLNCDRAFT_52363 [Chlorella variabilis]EFN55711.1 hypothetical protein CHLNCDRAFT_52363 [Chlorella variabilis]|eukprot:XP_005847813.1 hypothetical protein CHLNCDRAFT_52363 [Chlorella variabilis]